MPVDSKPFPRQEVPGISVFHSKEYRSPHKLTWKVLYSPAFVHSLHSLNLSGLKRRHSQIIIRQQGFTSIKMSSQVMETAQSNWINEQNLVVPRLSTAYETAMEALSSLISRKKRGEKSKIGSKYEKLTRMSMYVKILGLEEHLAGLNIIHVAGTKGKGSTCAFCEAIMRECGFRTGLFTSPHLMDVRERFRLNGSDITEDKFLIYFWDCWNQLKENLTEDLPMPPLFQFLTLLAFKIFVHEKVDVAIIEVGLGGTNDSTNVIMKPVVCGITSLGMDHMEVLGDTLGKIASHKAGILKPQVPAFSVPQLSEAMDVLLERANELMVPLEVVTPLDCRKLNGMKLSLSGDHQYTNAGLAVSLCNSWLRSTGNWEKLFQYELDGQNSLPEQFLKGLSTARLSGRAEIVRDSLLDHSNFPLVNGGSSGDLVFYFDGAHSPESMEACGRWFSSAVKDDKNSKVSFPCRGNGDLNGVCGNIYLQNGTKEPQKISKQILLFNCMDLRDPEVLPQLVNTCAASGMHFSKAIFVPSISTYNKVTSGTSVIPSDLASKDLTWQFNLQRIWEKLVHGKDYAERSVNREITECFPRKSFLYEDVSHCKPAEGYFACSTVASSLPLTIKWLRDCAMENPCLRVQVLVTGSLHLVGDVLKLIRR